MLNELMKALEVDRKVQVTVWDSVDEKVEYTFHSYVMELSDKRVMIAGPSAKDVKQILPRLQPGYVIGIVIEVNPSPVIFYPIIDIPPKNADEGFWLRIPQNPQVELAQRRRHVRIPMYLPLEVEYQFGAVWKPVQASTEDVSGGGMRFTSAKQFFKDQNIRLHIKFSNDLPMLHLLAKVVFCTENRLKRKPDDLFATACQFYDLDNAHETIIVRECFRRELMMKEKRM